MERRAFVKHIWTVSVVGCTLPALAVHAAEGQVTKAGCDLESATGLKSFAYYEGLAPTGTRSPTRTDGTYYNMPCIAAADIEAALEKTYDFWHGHSTLHRFTLTVEHFETLKTGVAVEVLTTVVDSHRHALRVTPDEACGDDT